MKLRGKKVGRERVDGEGERGSACDELGEMRGGDGERLGDWVLRPERVGFGYCGGRGPDLTRPCRLAEVDGLDVELV